MPKNGAPTDGDERFYRDDPDLFEGIVEELDEIEPGQPHGYVGYEQLIGTLMWAASQAHLSIYNVANTIDTTSLERRYRANCVPENWRAPMELSAKIELFWPAEYTALSVYGDEVFCSLYHDESDLCVHQEGPAELVTELTVEYHLPYDFVSALNSDEGIEATAKHIRRLFSSIVGHDNIVNIEVAASYTDGGLKLTRMMASHFWTLELELLDSALLNQVLLSICQEISKVLQRFAEEFAPSNRRRSP